MAKKVETNPFMQTNNKNPKFKHPDFEVFDFSDRHAQVCSKHSPRETLKLLKESNPGDWKLARKYQDGPNPSICDDMPRTHKQFLYEN